MTVTRYVVCLNGERYFMFEDPRIPGCDSALCRPGDFEHFRDAYAHLDGHEGLVYRYQEVIGRREDIEVLSEVGEPETYPTIEEWIDGLLRGLERMSGGIDKEDEER